MSRFIKICLISLLAIVGSKPTVAAIVITDAFVNLYDKVVVKGKYAQPYSYISWEDTVVDKAGATGSFSFKSSVVPEDCVGKLSDGTETIDVNIDNCTPAPTAEGIPKGVIVMWSGSVSNIPEGWALCDGTNGTPDLRDKFILGAGGSLPETGGTTSHSHSLPGHAHTISADGNHSHHIDVQFYNCIGDCSDGADDGSKSVGSESHGHHLITDTQPAGNHSHSGQTGSAGGGTSGGANHLPPYYALAFIMKL